LIDLTIVDDAPPDYLIDGLAARGFLTVLVGKRTPSRAF
jgi:hypothetical protein